MGAIAGTATPAAEPPVRAADIVPDVAGRTVLYVEDNLASLELIERTLCHRPALRVVPLMQGGLAHELLDAIDAALDP